MKTIFWLVGSSLMGRGMASVTVPIILGESWIQAFPLIIGGAFIMILGALFITKAITKETNN